VKVKKRHRNDPSRTMEEEQVKDDVRDDLNTKESFLSDEYYYEYDGDNTYHDNEYDDNTDDDTATTGEGDMGSLAGMSLGSLGK